MRQKIKIIILFLMLIVLTGCSGNYNIKINADLSIEEKLELNVENSDDTYEKTLKIFEDNKINKDKYDVNISNDEVIIKYKDKYDSIEDYIINSKVYPQIFNKIQYNKGKDYIELYVDENLKIKNNNINSSSSNLTDLDVIQLNIENPFNINYTNAEITNQHMYTWTIKKGDTNKKIYMQFKPNFNKFPYRPVIVGILILIVSFYLIYKLVSKYKKTQRF